MKIIKLYAYWANNLGDDLMVDILLSKYPQYFFYSEDCHYSSRFNSYENFKNKEYFYRKYGRINHLFNILTFNKMNDFVFKKLFKKIEDRCICSVYIGGSIYMQNSIQEKEIDKRVEIEKKKLGNGPLFIIGANFGPALSNYFIESFKNYFSLCAGVSFRDKKSYLLFSELLNVQYSHDVVFNMKKTNRKIHKNNHVIISVIDLLSRDKICQYREDYENFVISLCYECIAIGKIPVLMSFCEIEGDTKAIYRIYNKLNEDIKNKIIIYCYTNNLEEAVNKFECADMIIATRFHAMILALVFGKPFFAISYNDKIKHVLEDIECTSFCSLSDLHKIDTRSLITDMKNFSNIDKCLESSRHQFDQLEEYLRYESQK